MSMSPCYAALIDGKASQDSGFVERLIAAMIRNIQITVKNIHIRYEDAVSILLFNTLTHARIVCVFT